MKPLSEKEVRALEAWKLKVWRWSMALDESLAAWERILKGEKDETEE